MKFAGRSALGRAATRLATAFAPPYQAMRGLAELNSKGYISPKATIHHDELILGSNIFIAEGVVIFKDYLGGPVELMDRANIHMDTIIQTGFGGKVSIGADSYIQPRCQFSAYKSSIKIGNFVQIAPNCAFYPYNHSTEPDKKIAVQPLTSRGGIIIEDDVWLGYGVIVLDGVRIGKGAVIGAGSVVKSDIPAGAIAAGVPARVIKMRSESTLD